MSLSNNFPTINPTLNLDFANVGALDPRVTFTRASTATYFNSLGVLTSASTNAPRFDYDPVTLAAKGLLIEEQRTNLLTYSEQFDDASWTKLNATITANTTTAPDGTTIADTFTSTATTGATYVSKAVLPSGANAFSVYAKVGTHSFIQLMNAGDSGAFANFDLTTGVVGTTGVKTTGVIQNVGNGWYRCTALFLATVSYASGNRCYMVASASSGYGSTFAGTGAETFYIWGAQLEAGAFPTSYIPTVASQVTRSADVASVNTLSPWYNATEGTLYAETGATADGVYPTALVMTDGTTSNNILIQANSTAVSQQLYVVSGGAVQVNLATQTFSNALTKTAAAYKANDYAYSTQGAAASTDTTALVPTVSQMVIGAERTSNLFNGCIRRITYYPRRLSNTELQAITA